MWWNRDYRNVMALKHAKHLCSVSLEDVDAEEANTISQVKYLKYLSMSLEGCKTLPDGISDVWSLQALHVVNNYSLVEIPESIGKLQKLRILNLSWCRKLKCLPDSLGDCQMISSIDLSKCKKLTMLPDSIGRNEMLRVLRLGHTKVERLPSSITKLRNLECLDLRGCHELVELPEGIGNLEKLQVLNLKGCKKLGGMPVGFGQLSRLQKLGLFVVGKGEKFAGISELANVSRIGEELTIRGISDVLGPKDAHMACLKQKTHIQRLDLEWMKDDAEEVNTELAQAILDGLEPPPGINELKIYGYSGRQYARWMQNQVGSEAHGPAMFSFLRVMHQFNFPSLKHLHGLAELPCLEELYLKSMHSLESISGGPFPSLVKLEMRYLACLGEMWMVNGEQGEGCFNFTPQFGQVRVGNCLRELEIFDCPKLEVKPHLPLSLKHLHLWSTELLLQSPGQFHRSSWFPCFSHLQELRLSGMGLESGKWELLQYMTALETLNIYHCKELTELPESVGSLTSLRSLKMTGCSAICMLPESLGELRSLQKLTITEFSSLSSLPQSMGHITSLQELVIEYCGSLEQLPECLGELCSLRILGINGLRGLTCLPQSVSSLTSLKRLFITDCPILTSLPEGMKGLSSLEDLSIKGCPEIKSLQDDIKDLTSLKTLRIEYCPSLARRCEREEGDDWNLISHIPDLQFW